MTAPRPEPATLASSNANASASDGAASASESNTTAGTSTEQAAGTRVRRVLRRHAARARRQGRDAFALVCLQRLAALDAADAVDYCAMGEIQLRRGAQAEGLDAYLQALRLAPRDVAVHLALGRALVSHELFGDARDIFERALRLDDARAETHVDLADALFALGDVSRAATLYERARQLDPREAGAYRGLARVRLDRGGGGNGLPALPSLRSAEGVSTPEGTVATDGADDDDVDTAIRLLRTALNLRPRDARACRLLIEALQRRGDGDADADLVGAWFSLGVTLQESGDLTGAAEALESAIARSRHAECLRAWLRLADVRLALRQPDEAVRCLEAAVAIDPEHPAAHVNLGWALRTAGHFARGWQESAWNYRAGDRRRFEQPMWDGTALGDRTMLCWADFALGDTIQDLRYLTLIRTAHPHARIVLECDRRLISLIERNTVRPPLADVIIASKAPLPAFDCHVPLRRLPEVLGIDVESIPARVPYLSVADEQPRDRMKVTRIGIVWAGDQTRADARTKSAALADFAPLATLATQLADAGTPVRIISLQLGPNVDELIAAPPGLSIERVLEPSFDVADTAAIMRTLDAIVTVDTMTAHLAGALGRPVWVLAAYAPAWWLWHLADDAAPSGVDTSSAEQRKPSLPLRANAAAEFESHPGRLDAHEAGADDGARSRWYPTMRIIRQPQRGDWASVIGQVCAALRHTLATTPPASASTSNP